MNFVAATKLRYKSSQSEGLVGRLSFLKVDKESLVPLRAQEYKVTLFPFRNGK